jgi:hypothetical protein
MLARRVARLPLAGLDAPVYTPPQPLTGPLLPPTLLPLPLVLNPQVQESSEWDSLVLAAFEEMDVDCSGAISTRSLELLLCGEDGCQVRVCVNV